MNNLFKTRKASTHKGTIVFFFAMSLLTALGAGCNGEGDASGGGGSTTPTTTPDYSNYYMRDVEEISATDSATCLRKAARAGQPNVYCWGDATHGQNGQTQNTPIPTAVYFSGHGAGPIEDATKIVSGTSHSCALRQNGEVACWGKNDLGQLGSGSVSASSARAYIVKKLDGSSLTGVVDIAAGNGHSCAITSGTRTIYCWGSNFTLQLGNFAGTHSPNAMQVMLGAAPGTAVVNAATITAGSGFTCYQGITDQVYCWGSNVAGALGFGSANTAPSATAKLAKTSGFDVYAAVVHSKNSNSCAIDISDNIFCWGANESLQIGSSTLASTSNALFMTSADSVRSAAGSATLVRVGGKHACVIDNGRNDRRVYCWGANDKQQLGVSNSVVAESTNIPRLVQGVGNRGFLTGVTDLALGLEHGCALFENKTVACWGSDSARQIGYVGSGAGAANFTTASPTMIYDSIPPGL